MESGGRNLREINNRTKVYERKGKWKNGAWEKAVPRRKRWAGGERKKKAARNVFLFF